MQKAVKWVGCVAVTWGLFGCASSQTQSQGAADLAKAAVEGREVPIMVLQFPNLQRDWPAIAHMIPEDSELAPLREAPLELLLPGMAGQGLGSAMDLSTRCEVGIFSASLDADAPSAMIISVPISDTKDALAELGDEFILTDVAGGATRLTPRPTLQASLFEEGPVCEIWGSGRGVLTCGAMGDYTSGRGVMMAERVLASSTVDPKDTTVFEFSADTFGKAMQTDGTGKSRAEVMGQEVVMGVVKDLNLGRFGVSLVGAEPRFGIELEFGTRHSVLTSSLLDTSAAMALDDVFFRLPAESDFAAQFSGMPRGHRKGDVHALLRKIVEASAEGSEFEAEGVEPLTESMSQLFLTGGPSIIATGMDESAYSDALGNFLQKGSVTPADVAALQASAQSWTLFGLKEPAQEWMANFAKMHEIDVRYSKLSDTAVKQGSLVGKKNQRPEKVDAIPGRATRSITYAMEAPAGAPAGAAHYISETYVNPEFADQLGPGGLPYVPAQTHLLIAGAGDYTWICMADDVAVCSRHLQNLQKGGSTTLASHPMRNQLQAQKANILGLTSINGFLLLFLEDDSVEDLKESYQQLHKLRVQPGAARMPIALSGASSPVAGGAGKLRLDATIGAPELLVITSLIVSD